VGEQKLKDFAEPFLAAIGNYLQANPRRQFAAPNEFRLRRASLNESEEESLRRFRAGDSIEQIARARGFVRNTVLDHLARAVEAGIPLTTEQFFSRAQAGEIATAFERAGAKNLVGVREQLGGKFEIGELRIFRALAARAPSSAGARRAEFSGR
jgi:DNA-binding CsgD family transcriptional regulator